MQTFGSRRLTGWRWAVLIAAVGLAGLIPAGLWNDQNAPMDVHEIYVARSVEEMIQRRNLLVPHYNGHARINKPPLNYWLVYTANLLTGRDVNVIDTGEARVPSMLAAVVWAMLVVLLGAVLVDRPTGLLAGAMLVGFAGFSGYAHSARPDMVMAMFCTLGLLGFAIAYRQALTHSAKAAAPEPLLIGGPRTAEAPAAEPTVVEGPSSWPRWLGWGGMLMAAMAKGFYVPLLMVGTIVVYLACTGRRKWIGRSMGLGWGLPLFLMGFAAWYVVVLLNVPEAWSSWGEELGSRLDARDRQWWIWLNPFYLWSTGLLVAPFVLLMAAALFVPVIKRFRGEHGVKIMWWVALVIALAFQILWERRRHYTLPALGPLAIVMATVALVGGRGLIASGRAWLWRGLIVAHLAAIAGGVMLLALYQQPLIAPPLAGAALVAGLAAATIVALKLVRRKYGEPLHAPLYAVAAIGAVMFGVLSLNGSMSSVPRVYQRSAHEGIGRIVGKDQLLVAWNRRLLYAPYYLHRNITNFTDADQLEHEARRHPGLYVMMSGGEQLPVDCSVQEVYAGDTVGNGARRSAVVLVRLNAPGIP